MVARNADIIWLCLDNEEELNAVFQVLLGSDVKGKIFIVVGDKDTPSANEERSRELLVKHVQAKGAQLVSLQGRLFSLLTITRCESIDQN